MNRNEFFWEISVKVKFYKKMGNELNNTRFEREKNSVLSVINFFGVMAERK